jgi:uncharacterized protein
MKTSLHAIWAETFAPVLRTLSELLDKGAQQVRAKGGDPATLVSARLAPDMFPLGLQVQVACHHAKDITARLTGQQPPKLENKELTLPELKTLIEQTLALLRGVGAKAFDGGEDRRIEMTLQGGRLLEADGLQFLCHWSMPHFYFHVVTAYDILRHSGIEIGKRDYMTHAAPYVRQVKPA